MNVQNKPRENEEIKKGFTLIELIVVIAVIAVLAAIIAPNAFKAIEKSMAARAAADLKAIKTASIAFYSDIGTWPVRSLNETGWLENSSLVINPGWSGWDGPYLEKPPQADPWNGLYLYGAWNMGWGSAGDYTLKLTTNAYPSGQEGTSMAPFASLIKVDQTLDDGNPDTGDLKASSSTSGKIWWIIGKDCCP